MPILSNIINDFCNCGVSIRLGINFAALTASRRRSATLPYTIEWGKHPSRMPLRIKKYDQFELTVFKAFGAVTSEQITDALKCFYEETDAKPTKYALWDMRGASLEALDHWEAMWITQVVEYIGHGRDNGKTAIVAADDYDFDISRVIATCVPINLVIARAYRTIDEAAEWFRMDAERVKDLTNF